MSLSFFIPAFNEEEGLESCVNAVIEAFSAQDEAFELILVNDGSSDGTADLMNRLAAQDQRVRAVHHDKNRGYGAALRTGFAEAIASKPRAVGYTDADLPVAIDAFVRVLPQLQDSDVICGFRKQRSDSPHRALYSGIYNLLVRLLFGVRVRDVNFSFKWIRADLLNRMKLDSNTVFIDGQLLAEAKRLNARISEVPIDYLPRQHGSSKFDNPVHAINTALDLVRWWWKRTRR